MGNGFPTRITSLGIDPRMDDALKSLEVARNHLDQSIEPGMVEAACYEVSAAELRLRAAIRRAKAETQELARKQYNGN